MKKLEYVDPLLEIDWFDDEALTIVTQSKEPEPETVENEGEIDVL